MISPPSSTPTRRAGMRPVPALRKRIGDQLRGLVASVRGRGAAPRLPTLEAELPDAWRELVERVRGNLPPEEVEWPRVHAHFTRRALSQDPVLLSLIARDPRLLFENPWREEAPALVERHPPSYRGREIHWAWIAEARMGAPHLLMALIAAGMIEKDRQVQLGPLSKADHLQHSALEAACLNERDPKYLRALCADLGIALPDLYVELIADDVGPVAKFKRWRVSVAIDEDRSAGRSPHLHKVLPGAPSPMALLVNRVVRKGAAYAEQDEASACAQMLDLLMEARIDPAEPVWTEKFGRVTPLEAFLRESNTSAAPCLAVHLIGRRPDLIDLVPDFEAVSLLSESRWRWTAELNECHGLVDDVSERAADAIRDVRAQIADAKRSEPTPIGTDLVRRVRGWAARIKDRRNPQPTGRHVDPKDPAAAPTKLEKASGHQGRDAPLPARCDDLGIAFPNTYQIHLGDRGVSTDDAILHIRALAAALAMDLAAGIDIRLEQRVPGAPSLLALEVNRLLEFRVAPDQSDELPMIWRELFGRFIDAGADPSECIWVRDVGRVTPLEALLTAARPPIASGVALDLIARQPDLMERIPDFQTVAKIAAETWRSWGSRQVSIGDRANGMAAITAAADLDAVRVIYDQRSAPWEPAPARTPKPSSGARARVF